MIGEKKPGRQPVQASFPHNSLYCSQTGRGEMSAGGGKCQIANEAQPTETATEQQTCCSTIRIVRHTSKRGDAFTGIQFEQDLASSTRRTTAPERPRVSRITQARSGRRASLPRPAVGGAIHTRRVARSALVFASIARHTVGSWSCCARAARACRRR